MSRDVPIGDMPLQPRRPEPGRVYWITGLAGAGKTTLGRLLALRLEELGRRVVFLDGDALRDAVFPDAGYSPPERLELAGRYSRLCGVLAEQGLDVVCATISMFPEIWERNRRAFAAYSEILVRAPAPVLARRRKALYGPTGVTGDGERGHVVGLDAPAPAPAAADLVIDNDGSRTPDELVDEMLRRLATAASGGRSTRG